MSKPTKPTDTSSSQSFVSPVADSIILTPTSSTTTEPSQRDSSKYIITARRADLNHITKMDETSSQQTTAVADRDQTDEAAAATATTAITAEGGEKLQDDEQLQTERNQTTTKKKTKCQKSAGGKQSNATHKVQSKRKVKDESESGSSSDDSSDTDDDDSSKDSSTEEEVKRKKKPSKSKRTKKGKDKKRRKSRKQKSDHDDDTTESEASETSSEEEVPRKKKSSKKAKIHDLNLDGTSSPPEADVDGVESLKTQLTDLMAQLAELKCTKSSSKRRRSSASKSSKSKSKSKKIAESLDFKRVDQLWDDTAHQYQLKESAEEDDQEFADFAFLVRRRFDWENKYTNTVVDIKSKQLRHVLAEVMKDCKSVSMEAMEPCIDPNLLFVYLEALRTHYKQTLKSRIKAEKKKKAVKKLETQRSLTKTLVKYLDEDYADIKKTLVPLLEAGNITFDLLWALFTPNDVAITSCYGSWDHPRCFKMDYAQKLKSLTRGEYYTIEGRYMEYDGKSFGWGDMEAEIDKFQGPRRITSLACYPLKFHKDVAGIKKRLVERGQNFVSMEGMQYKFHKGLAFMKKKKQVLRININGRVMIDPATFRRINPNYPISMIKPKDEDELEDLDGNDADDDDHDDCSCCACNPDSDNENLVAESDQALEQDESLESAPKFKYKWVEHGPAGHSEYVAVEVDDDGKPIQMEKLDRLASGSDRARAFTEEQLLLTSPVVVGFAFSEKLWLEFTLSGVHDVSYNDEAFDALVLPNDQKSTVRALVESHKFHAAKTIDDVIVGKGQGCVIVLHGKPGVGKTLTAEAISELTRSPLYTISAGELGTDPARLEQELEKILSIAHSWGAVLLLDEADVFLEKRGAQDVHRNALVSVFLRQLEYCQNLLVLTTNRVETFDEAFHSRIHLALRYGDLSAAAKKSIWRTFLSKARSVDGATVVNFSEADFDSLARHALNGRQIKNVVRTAQALALHEQTTLSLVHIKRVLDVAETFDRDLRGGTGYLDAMRSYT